MEGSFLENKRWSSLYEPPCTIAPIIQLISIFFPCVIFMVYIYNTRSHLLYCYVGYNLYNEKTIAPLSVLPLNRCSWSSSTTALYVGQQMLVMEKKSPSDKTREEREKRTKKKKEKFRHHFSYPSSSPLFCSIFLLTFALGVTYSLACHQQTE